MDMVTRKVMGMGTRQKWVGMILLVAALLLAGAGPGQAWRGGHGFRGHGFHHGFRGPRVAIGIGIGAGPFWGPYWGWGPYWPRYAYPPVVIAPPPVVVQPSQQLPVQPPPPQFWYYCHNPKGYYPYVQQCPGGWRQVAPTPP
jgi:hypothetical protein